MPSDLHVCDTCAEPLLPVDEWNRGLTLVLSGLLVAGAVVGILLARRPVPPPVPPCCVPPMPQEIALALSLEAVGGCGRGRCCATAGPFVSQRG